jgi:branched-chain amino acid transport system substrate-binding protein
VLITPSSQSADITGSGDYIFRTQINTAQEAPFFARFVAQMTKGEPVHVIGINTEYTPSVLEYFEPELEKYGGKLGKVELVETEETDFRSVLLKLKQKDARYLMITTVERSTAELLKQAKELNLEFEQIFAPSPIESAELLRLAGNAVEGMIYSYPYDSESEQSSMRLFREKYFEKFGEENEMLAATAYDAVNLLSDCFEKTGDNPEKVKDCLYSTKDYPGASGTFSIDRNGDVEKQFILKTVKDGKFVRYEK